MGDEADAVNEMWAGSDDELSMYEHLLSKPKYPEDKAPRDFSKSPCPYCGMSPKLVHGTVVYPHRRDLGEKMFWHCAPCKAWVGCHPGTTHPLGTLANAPLRKLRMKVHGLMDPLWKKGKMKRSAAYKLLRGKLGISKNDCHVSKFDDTLCLRAIEALKSLSQLKPKP